MFRLFLVSAGRDSSVGIATRYGLDGPGIESRWEATFSAPVQTGPGTHPASYTMGTRSFLGCKAAGASRWPPIPSIAEVKERVELYLYSHCLPSWTVVGWTSFSQPRKVCSDETRNYSGAKQYSGRTMKFLRCRIRHWKTFTSIWRKRRTQTTNLQFQNFKWAAIVYYKRDLTLHLSKFPTSNAIVRKYPWPQ